MYNSQPHGDCYREPSRTPDDRAIDQVKEHLMARAADDKAKNQARAAYLIRMGYPHGRRMTSPYPNSGGLDPRQGLVGSAAHQRLTGQVSTKTSRKRSHKRPA